MADYCCTYSTQELQDDVHRLLPSEIFKDIGIVDPAERRRLAAVEDIARRLAGVLGEATRRAHHPPPSCRRPEAIGGRDVLAGGGRDHVRRAAAPAPFLAMPPPAAVPWRLVQEAGRAGHTVLPTTMHSAAAALPRFAPAASPLLGGARPTTTTTARRSCGTGVFLPRTGAGAATVSRTAAKAARSPSNIGKLGSARGQLPQLHRHGDGAAVVRRQQELQAMVAKMEVSRRQYDAIDVHASCPELALPQEWTY